MKIRSLRIKCKLTQRDMGKLLVISESAYGLIETGRRKLSAERLADIANVLDVSMDSLMKKGG